MPPGSDPGRFAEDVADLDDPLTDDAGQPLYQWRAELPGVGDALLPERPPYLDPGASR